MSDFLDREPPALPPPPSCGEVHILTCERPGCPSSVAGRGGTKRLAMHDAVRWAESIGWQILGALYTAERVQLCGIHVDLTKALKCKLVYDERGRARAVR